MHLCLDYCLVKLVVDTEFEWITFHMFLNQMVDNSGMPLTSTEGVGAPVTEGSYYSASIGSYTSVWFLSCIECLTTSLSSQGYLSVHQNAQQVCFVDLGPPSVGDAL